MRMKDEVKDEEKLSSQAQDPHCHATATQQRVGKSA